MNRNALAQNPLIDDQESSGQMRSVWVTRKDHWFASTVALAWLTILTPFVVSPHVRAGDAVEEDSTTSQEDASSELSVAPMDHIEYPATRPDWVSSKPQFDDLGSDSIVIVAGPNESKEECLSELRLMRRAAISTYVLGLVSDAVNSDFYSIDDAEIDEYLVSRTYAGEVTAGGERMYEHAIELYFSPGEKAEIYHAWESMELGNRLGALGVVAGLGLMLLLCSGGLLGVFSRRVARKERARDGFKQVPQF